MVLANCTRCGTLYNQTTTDICMDCFKEEEELLREAQDFVRRNPKTSIAFLLEHVEIEQAMLNRWIEEKQINIKNAESAQSTTICITCGRQIPKGEKICKTCLFKQISKNPNGQPSAYKSEEEEEEEEKAPKAAGMHMKHFR